MKIQPMEIKPIAYFRSPVGGKFALPRQAGLAPSLHGRVVLEPGYRSPDALASSSVSAMNALASFGGLWSVLAPSSGEA